MAIRNADEAGAKASRYADAVRALGESRWREAQSLAMSLVRDAPTHAGVHFVAGLASLHLEQMPLATELLKRAVALNPGRADYLAQFSRALAMGRSMRQAIHVADRAMSLRPADALTLDTLGVVFTQGNDHAKAVDAFRLASRQVPDHAGFHFNLATSLTFVGELDEAELEYRHCLRLQPRYWKAYLALSQLRKQSGSTHHLEWLRSVLAGVGDDIDGRLYVNLAIAKELEDLGEFGPSLDHLVTGKSAKALARCYTSRRDEEIFAAIREACGPIPRTVAGSDSSEPIFVIGMPRSGTTLVDRILSSHSGVSSAGELQNFGVLLKRASGSRTRDLLDVDTVSRAGQLDWRALGDAYVASTRPGTGHTPRFVDKLPHNFIYAGFIARALPGARIVCLRRNPMDTCLSNFRQLFALTSPYYDYSFDLLDTGHYYVLFDALMAHWRKTMPGRFFELRYEDLVDDQVGQTRRLLEACGLPWEDGCLRFEDNTAPVATASAVQVRSPIHRSALDRWRRYGARLDGLRELLERSGIAVDRPAA